MPLTRRGLLNATGCMLATATLTPARAQHQQPHFSISALPLLPGCDYSRVSSINKFGHAVGVCGAGPYAPSNLALVTRAALWRDGKVIDLQQKEFPSPWAFQINDRGQILLSGNFRRGESEYRLLWDGKIRQVWHEADGFLPDTLNNLGEMAGSTRGGSRVAFLGRNGKVVPIDVSNKGG